MTLGKTEAEETVVEFAQEDSFALHVATEAIRKTRWLENPEACRTKFRKETTARMSGTGLRYLIEHEYRSQDPGERPWRITVGIEASLTQDGLSGSFSIESSCHGRKVRGECSAFYNPSGSLTKPYVIHEPRLMMAED